MPRLLLSCKLKVWYYALVGLMTELMLEAVALCLPIFSLKLLMLPSVARGGGGSVPYNCSLWVFILRFTVCYFTNGLSLPTILSPGLNLSEFWTLATNSFGPLIFEVTDSVRELLSTASYDCFDEAFPSSIIVLPCNVPFFISTGDSWEMTTETSVTWCIRSSSVARRPMLSIF